MGRTWWTFGGWNSIDDDDDDDDIFSTGRSSYYGRKYNSSLGWSRNKLTDTASYYSGYGRSYSTCDLTSKEGKSNLILLSKAYKAVRDMVVILDFPFEVVIRLNNGLSGLIGKSSKTRTICVPSDVIDRSEYTDDERINILCGLGTHEASHLKYTEYRTYNSYVRNATREEKFFTNLIEDVRVEDKLLSERPGYLDFIEESIKFRYVKLSERIKDDSYSTKFLLNVVKFIRYPDKIDADVIKKYESQFKEIKSILSENAQFTKDSCIIGNKLYNYLVTMFLELKYPTTLIKTFVDMINPDDAFEVKYGMDAGSGNLLPSEMGKILGDGMSKIYSDIISGEIEFGEGDKTFIEKPTGSIVKYLEIKNKISKYIPGIKKLIIGTDKNYDFVIHGCREGALDTNKLAEAYQGVPQVYIKKGKVTTNKTTVCVLIDQSGSMSGCKMELARDAAILLNESLKDLPGVSLYIYGHTADEKITGGTTIYTYREDNKYKPAYALTAANAYANNRDGVAILETAKRVRKNTQDKCIMFILSDGSPAAHGYTGWSSVEDVKKKVQQVEKMGFTVIQISIDYVRYAKEMFSNVISLDYDLANLPKRLSQIIKKSIVKDKQTTVS